MLSRHGPGREGIAALRAALDQALAQSLPDTAAELQQRLADALEHSGDYQAATAAYAAAYQYCDAHGADAVGQLCRACASAVCSPGASGTARPASARMCSRRPPRRTRERSAPACSA